MGQLLQTADPRLRGAGLRVLVAAPSLCARAGADGQADQGGERAHRDPFAGSGMLAAGLRGIEEGYELPDEVDDDVEAMTADERAKRGILALPEDLTQAVREMERSELMAEALGEHVFAEFIENKRLEWEEYRA